MNQQPGDNNGITKLEDKEIIMPNPEFLTPLPEPKDFEGWNETFRELQELQPSGYNHVEFKFQRPMTLNFISDLHAGGPHVFYDRIKEEAECIASNRESYVCLMGDAIDAMNWNPGQYEQTGQVPLQLEWYRSLMQFFADEKRLLLVLRGDHDGWMLKMGFDAAREIPLRYNAHATHGPTEMLLMVGNQEYRGMLAHQFPGNSMYNKLHPQMRAVRFGGAAGSDFVVSGHNHQKGYATDWVDEWGGVRQVHYLALGAYKPTDGWLKKKGYKVQDPRQMFGAALKFDDKTKEITYFHDIVKANRKRRWF